MVANRFCSLNDAIGRIDAVHVRAADDNAALQAAACQHQAPSVWIMIATASGIQPRACGRTHPSR